MDTPVLASMPVLCSPARRITCTMLKRPEDILPRLLYRDAMMLIIDKPAGIPVHAGFGGGINLEQFFEPLRFGLPRPPSLAHRLDKDTSGCLVLGRHRQALKKLGQMFEKGRIEKTYWAIVRGKPDAAEGRIDLPLAPVSQRGGWKMQPDPEGQEAVTEYKILGHKENLSWLELKPRTGRTHQLRIHCMAMGWPLLGDSVYGGEDDKTIPLHLHARAIRVPLYPKRDPIVTEAPPPEHMNETLRHFEQR